MQVQKMSVQNKTFCTDGNTSTEKVSMNLQEWKMQVWET